MGIGIPGIILLVLIALLLFGPNKLPELGRAVGRTLREFKTGANEMMDSNSNSNDKKNEDAVRVEVNQSEQLEKNNKRLPD